jgi:hypothetical protein
MCIVVAIIAITRPAHASIKDAFKSLPEFLLFSKGNE